MRCRNPFLGVGLALLAVLVSSPGFGQERRIPPSQKSHTGRPEVPENFGTTDVIFDFISVAEFLPDSGEDYDSDLQVTGTRWKTAGSSLLYAPITRVPNGARVVGLDVYYYDNSPIYDLTFDLCRYYRDTSFGGNPAAQCSSAFTSSGTPGHTYTFIDLDFDFLRRFNIDGDPELESVDYILRAFTRGLNGDVRIGHVRVRWKRQVSPAPAFATFTDVPVGHPQHRFVQALAAAGITAGCGGGNFCPNAPLTRGQMAVFLSAALGLHWSPF